MKAMKEAMKAVKVMKVMKVIKAMKVMKAMKGMKATKAMKAMKKVKKVSIIARGKLAKSAVFNGTKAKTSGGLTKNTLIKSKSGKIVSKAASASSKKRFASSV